MKLLQTFVNNFIKKEPVILLGRWNIVYCEKKINKKVDLSNEDHCGTCSQHNINSTQKNIESFIFFETM